MNTFSSGKLDVQLQAIIEALQQFSCQLSFHHAAPVVVFDLSRCHWILYNEVHPGVIFTLLKVRYNNLFSFFLRIKTSCCGPFR